MNHVVANTILKAEINPMELEIEDKVKDANEATVESIVKSTEGSEYTTANRDTFESALSGIPDLRWRCLKESLTAKLVERLA